jgi:class III poly(R)-hydroxyalkanoic acid synthase PhaE subunit
MTDEDEHIHSELEVTHDFFELWLKAYEATYGKLIETPAVGPTRERIEKVRKTVDTSVNLYAAWMQSVASFQSVFAEATRRTRQHSVEHAEEGETPLSSRDYYELWMETFSETFKEFLSSPAFASDLGHLTSLSVDYQKCNQEMLESNVLKPMAVPTRTEIDEINKEVYMLKKTVKDLNKRVAELSRKV